MRQTGFTHTLMIDAAYCDQDWNWYGNSVDATSLDIVSNWNIDNLSVWCQILINGSNGLSNTAELYLLFLD